VLEQQNYKDSLLLSLNKSDLTASRNCDQFNFWTIFNRFKEVGHFTKGFYI
jgi:hypothetical protein